MASLVDLYFRADGSLDEMRRSWAGTEFASRMGTTGLAVGGFQRENAQRRESLHEALGVVIDTSLWFKLDKERLEDAVDLLADMFVAWALRLDGDLVLMKDGDEPVAYRRSGRVVVQRRKLSDPWFAALPRVFRDVPHGLADIPAI